MAIKNATNDLTPEETAAVKAADAAGFAAALAGTATIHADESTALPALIRALRGRGVASPLNILLNMYFRTGQGTQTFNREVALACAATPGTIDDSRSVEES